MRRFSTQFLRAGIDVFLFAGAFALAYLLRFDFAVPARQVPNAVLQGTYVISLQILALSLAGVYSYIWRYVGLAETWGFMRAAAAATAPIVLLRLLLPDAARGFRVPMSVIIIDAILAFGFSLSVRVARRVLNEWTERRGRKGAGARRTEARVLLIGAGQAGVLAAREITRRGDLGLHLVGFVDDDGAKVGNLIHNLRVLGTTAHLPQLVSELAIDYVIITIAQAPRAEIKRIIELCQSIGINARIIPGLYEILDGSVEITRIRNVEIEDLLGRDPIRLDIDDIAHLITGKTVMVTGAGGSIGSELARQVARFCPDRLLLVERAEFALFEIDRELRNEHHDFPIEALVADISDESRLRAIFTAFRPHVVVHAAAHKHVPLMELQPCEAIKNNVLGTRLLAEITGEFRAQAFVQISTDKAVNPTSVMGASKRVAELVVQDFSRRYPETRFVAVRFGNVLGSAGSVIPIFRKQIAAGGPVTVTHPDMTRYFMTIPEASQLVLQAAAIGAGGEVFVLDMGEPVKIVDLAKQMIQLSGFKVEEIGIAFTGIRPGEKLFEELDRTDEELSRTKHPKIFNGNVTPYAPFQLRQYLARLEQAARKGLAVEVRSLLANMLPEARLQTDGPASNVPQTALAVVDAEAEVDEMVGAGISQHLPVRAEHASKSGPRAIPPLAEPSW